MTTVFLAGNWDIATFLFSCVCCMAPSTQIIVADMRSRYFTLGLFPVVYLTYKLIKRPPFMKTMEMDLRTGLDEIDFHEKNHIVKPSR